MGSSREDEERDRRIIAALRIQPFMRGSFLRRKQQRVFRKVRNYFQAQLALLSELLLGRQYTVIEALQKDYGVDELIEGMFDTDLPEGVRAMYVRMLAHLYVEVAPQRSLVWPRLTRLQLGEEGGSGCIAGSMPPPIVAPWLRAKAALDTPAVARPPARVGRCRAWGWASTGL